MYIPKGLPNMEGAELQFVVLLEKDTIVAHWIKGTTAWTCFWDGLEKDYYQIDAYPVLEKEPPIPTMYKGKPTLTALVKFIEKNKPEMISMNFNDYGHFSKLLKEPRVLGVPICIDSTER